jgi:diguanylate cyclase (GGDEF)-like protein
MSKDVPQGIRGIERALFLPLGAVAIALGAHLLGVGFGPLDGFFERWAFLVVELGASAVCLLRAVLVPEERRAWMLMGLGVTLWALGDLYYRVELIDLEAPPVPSIADAFWLACYPFFYAGIALLIRARAHGVRATVWIDGLIAALAVATLATAIVFNAVLGSIGGEPFATATNLAYPLMDTLLLAFVVAGFAITGWRLDRTFVWLAFGLALFAVSDSIYLYKIATETYVPNGLLDAGWSVALLLTGIAAWRFDGRRRLAQRRESWRSIVLPILFGIIVVGVETYDHYFPVTVLSLGLAAACLLAVFLRLAITFAQNLRMLDVSREEATTDPLTALANRRRLALDLDEAVLHSDGEASHLLVLLDLNGFKLYNDSFGHPAGDALLTRLSGRLAADVGGRGTAYRMGGDEFCVLVPDPGEETEAQVFSLAGALSERGDGFSIDCSYGWAALPAEAHSSEAALRLVDQRMYAQKNSGRASARTQSKDVLLQALVERSPNLGPHLNDVAALATATAEELGLADTEVEQIRVAGELHDIGKVAIPDAILNKPGPLDPSEWEYVKRHSAVGERIVAAAPALSEVAKLVRCVHERVDGTGYPDGLAGEEIPIGARVVSVCDAFNAMTSDRPYRSTVGEEPALAELRRHAGTQFDPDVVRAFCAARERPRSSRVYATVA